MANRRRGLQEVVPAVLVLSILIVSQLPLLGATENGRPGADGAVPLTQSVQLGPYHYEGFEVESFSNGTVVEYAASSNLPISAALMSSAQYAEWQSNPSDPISNSIAYQNGTAPQDSLTIPPGQYFLVFYAYSGRSLIQFGFEVSPSTPYSYGGLTPPYAAGLASFGVYNASGTVTSYQVLTNEIVGVANISSVQVDTPNAFRYGVSTTGYTLQLNAMLVVDDGASAQKVYWVQNVPTFESGPSVVAFKDEIWNDTDSSGFLSNQTITSSNFQNGGFVYSTGVTRFSSGLTLYSYAMNNATYALPLDIGLLMNASLIPGKGVLVQTGYRLLSNGSAVSSPTVWFDNVTIHDPAAQSADFEVSGSATPPTGLYYDAEFVLAGEGNLESAYFTQLNASLGLFYQSGNSSLLSSFPSYYGFAGDTGEAASNLAEVYDNGVVNLSPGTPSYAYLGNATRSVDFNSLSVGTTTTSTTTPTASSTSTSQSTGTPPPFTTTSTTTSSATSVESTTAIPPPGGSGDNLLVAAAVAFAAVVIIIAALRLRPSSKPKDEGMDTSAGPSGPPPPPPPPPPDPASNGTV